MGVGPNTQSGHQFLVVIYDLDCILDLHCFRLSDDHSFPRILLVYILILEMYASLLSLLLFLLVRRMFPYGNVYCMSVYLLFLLCVSCYNCHILRMESDMNGRRLEFGSGYYLFIFFSCNVDITALCCHILFL